MALTDAEFPSEWCQDLEVVQAECTALRLERDDWQRRFDKEAMDSFRLALDTVKAKQALKRLRDGITAALTEYHRVGPYAPTESAQRCLEQIAALVSPSSTEPIL